MSVLVAGALHLDVVLTAPHLPALDETVVGSGVSYVFGGKGGNQAIAAARMGAQVHFAGRTGRDAFGEMIRAAFATSTVNITQLQQDPGPSGMSAAIVNADGDYGAVIVSAANLNIEAEVITIPAGCAIVVLQNEIPEQVNLVLAQKAKAAGARVWLNAAPARPLSADLVTLVDLLIVNRVEAAFYSDQAGAVPVLTTLGGDGVLYQGQTTPGFGVDVVSTHGAGDCFVGALAADVAAGVEIAEAIGFAQAAAALHVSSGLAERRDMDRQSVEAFRERHARR